MYIFGEGRGLIEHNNIYGKNMVERSILSIVFYTLHHEMAKVCTFLPVAPNSNSLNFLFLKQKVTDYLYVAAYLYPMEIFKCQRCFIHTFAISNDEFFFCVS